MRHRDVDVDGRVGHTQRERPEAEARRALRPHREREPAAVLGRAGDRAARAVEREAGREPAARDTPRERAWGIRHPQGIRIVRTHYPGAHRVVDDQQKVDAHAEARRAHPGGIHLHDRADVGRLQVIAVVVGEEPRRHGAAGVPAEREERRPAEVGAGEHVAAHELIAGVVELYRAEVPVGHVQVAVHIERQPFDVVRGGDHLLERIPHHLEHGIVGIREVQNAGGRELEVLVEVAVDPAPRETDRRFQGAERVETRQRRRPGIEHPDVAVRANGDR